MLFFVYPIPACDPPPYIPLAGHTSRRRLLAQLGSATGVYKTLVKYLVGVPQVCASGIFLPLCFSPYITLLFCSLPWLSVHNGVISTTWFGKPVTYQFPLWFHHVSIYFI